MGAGAGAAGACAFGAHGDRPKLLGAVGTGRDKVRLDFSLPMNPEGLAGTGNYTLTAETGAVSLTILSARLQNPTNPMWVELTLSGEMTRGHANYVVAVSSSFKDSLGNKMARNYRWVYFGGRGAPPSIIRVVADPLILTKLQVVFSEPVKQASASAADDALNPDNYTLSGGALVSAVTTLAPHVVELTVAGQRAGRSYTLTVSNVVDLAGNVI